MTPEQIAAVTDTFAAVGADDTLADDDGRCRARGSSAVASPIALSCLDPALVAQWIEHLTTDQKVGRSSRPERADEVLVRTRLCSARAQARADLLTVANDWSVGSRRVDTSAVRLVRTEDRCEDQSSSVAARGRTWSTSAAIPSRAGAVSGGRAASRPSARPSSRCGVRSTPSMPARSPMLAGSPSLRTSSSGSRACRTRSSRRRRRATPRCSAGT